MQKTQFQSPKKRICIMASGGGSNFQAVLESIDRGAIHGQVVLLVYDRRDAGAKKRAEARGIPARYINRKSCGTDEAFENANLSLLRQYEVDVIVLAGYLSIVGKNLIAAYENRIINVHPSLIPAFCGMGFYGQRVHQAVIDYGVKVSGCTVHFVTAEADAGPVILQECVDVLPDDDAHSLAARILEKEHTLLSESLSLLCADRLRLSGRKVLVEPYTAQFS